MVWLRTIRRGQNHFYDLARASALSLWQWDDSTNLPLSSFLPCEDSLPLQWKGSGDLVWWPCIRRARPYTLSPTAEGTDSRSCCAKASTSGRERTCWLDAGWRCPTHRAERHRRRALWTHRANINRMIFTGLLVKSSSKHTLRYQHSCVAKVNCLFSSSVKIDLQLP